jgi:hypothetical protein
MPTYKAEFTDQNGDWIESNLSPLTPGSPEFKNLGLDEEMPFADPLFPGQLVRFTDVDTGDEYIYEASPEEPVFLLVETTIQSGPHDVA